MAMQQAVMTFPEWIDQEDYRTFYAKWKSSEAMERFWQYLNHTLLAKLTPKTLTPPNSRYDDPENPDPNVARLTKAEWHAHYALTLEKWAGG